MPVEETDKLTLGDERAGATTYGGAARVAFVLVVCLYVAARVWRLTDSCLWFDEIFGVHAARHAWGQMLDFAAADLIHPPLFYALLKLWVGLGGESLWWLRLLPVLLSIAAIAPLLLLCRELRLGAWETNLALALAAVNGYLIKYAQEVRMYSLLLLLTLCSLWLFARLFNAANAGRARTTLVALAACNLLLVYTHYYGWLVVASEAALLLLLRRGRARTAPFLLTVALAAVAYLPWVYALAHNSGEQGRGLAQNIGWVERPAAGDILQFLALLHEPFYFRRSSAEPVYTTLTAPAGLLLFGVPILLLLWRLARRARAGDASRRGGLCWLLVFSFLPLLLAFALSWALPHSVWGTRHLIIVAAPYLIMAAAAVVRLRPVWARATVLVVLGCWVFWGALSALVRREAAPVWCAWEGHAARMMRDESEGAVAAGALPVYAFEDLVAYHLWFALDSARDTRFRVAVVKGVPGLPEDPAYFLPRAFDGVSVGDASALEGARIWAAFRDAAWDESRPPLKTILERGYRVEEVYETRAQGQRAFMVSFAKSR